MWQLVQLHARGLTYHPNKGCCLFYFHPNRNRFDELVLTAMREEKTQKPDKVLNFLRHSRQETKPTTTTDMM